MCYNIKCANSISELIFIHNIPVSTDCRNTNIHDIKCQQKVSTNNYNGLTVSADCQNK